MSKRLRIIQLLADGQTPQEIADSLGITRQQVFQQMDRTKNMWGAATTIELAVMAIKKGMIKIS
jgi:DNA-binding CsgD family transcriptional regulator